MKRPSMLIAMPLAQTTMKRLAEAGDVTVIDPGEAGEDEFQSALASHDGILCSAMQRIPDGCLERASDRLRVVSNFGVGYDNVNVALATRCGVRVCNTPGILSDAVAELVMLFILALARRLDDASGFVRGGHWGTESFPLAHDISGKTLGLVGFGRIGRAVAERALAFDMRVMASDVRDITEGPWEQVPFETLLAEADFVSVHVNLSQATRGLIGEESLGRMKRSAFLINTSRGPVVDTTALRQALVSGAIAGAALDVTDPEPPAPEDPLLSMPRVIITPHVGTGTVETREKMGDMAATNLIESLAGRQPPAVVNEVDLQLAGGT
ncbi:MAG: D-glycerate dehydrogenase [bacterium]|nr:D-glycerate dehydrogenase [bacterium]